MICAVQLGFHHKKSKDIFAFGMPNPISKYRKKIIAKFLLKKTIHSKDAHGNGIE